MIGERRAAILSLIIDYYINTGEPLGSKTMCEMLPYSISSATIRNEMAFLTELGFLEQRHTSGGRVPTKASYRYYVDNLMKPKMMNNYEKEIIDEALSINASDPERLLASAAKMLSETTGCASFYSTIKDPLDCVQGIELVPAGNNKAMLVMLSVGGKIKSSVITMNCKIDDEFRKLFYLVTNKFFIGVPLDEVDLTLIQSTAGYLGARVFDMLPILTSLVALCKEAGEGTLNIFGETKLLNQNELGDSVYNLLVLLAQKEKLKKILDDFSKMNTKSALLIGDENPIYELRNTTMAIARLNYNEMQVATLGIIGSTRIDYSSILPRVDYIIKTVSKILQKGGIVYE